MLACLDDFNIIGVGPVQPSAGVRIRFLSLDLAQEHSCLELMRVIRESRPEAVVHLGVAADCSAAAYSSAQRAWQSTVVATARVMEAVLETNRDGGAVRKLVHVGSALAYGSDLPGAVNEDFPLGGHTLASAIHARESDRVVQARAVWDRTDCSTYILRPQVLAGPSGSNYLFDGLRGGGCSLAAQPSRAPRSTFILPLGRRYLETPFQFVHVDDMARLIAFILRRPDRDARLTILNVAGRGEPVRMRDCVKISGTRLLRIPFRRLLNPALKLANRLGNKAVAPDAAAYMTGTHLLDTGRLRAFLGTEYERVIHYSNERALRDSFWDIRAEQPAAAYARRSAAN